MSDLFIPMPPNHHDGHYPTSRKRGQAQPLPRYLTRLDLICRNTAAHPLPVSMIFIGESVSDRGQQMCVYACAHDGCSWREGWVPDRENPRRPYRLFGYLYHR
jgi:hypothetical protein